METGDVEMRIAHLQLLQDVMPHLTCCAGRERRNRNIRELRAQSAELPVIGTKLVSPFRNAMRFVDREQSHRNIRQPLECALCRARRSGERYSSRYSPFAGIHHHATALRCILKAVERRGRNSHLRQLRSLILHQRNQRRNHDCCLSGNDRRKLVAKRFSATSRHHRASIVRSQQAADDILLLRDERNRIPNIVAAG